MKIAEVVNLYLCSNLRRTIQRKSRISLLRRRKASDTMAKRAQQAMTTAMSNALANGSLEFTVNGATYRRKSKRSRSFERVYG